MSRRDVFKSWFRAGADRAAERLNDVRPIAMLRRIAREARNQRTVIGDAALTRAAAHVPGVTSASVTVRDGGIHLDATFDSHPDLNCQLVPVGARFAPRGAKEILLRVEPVAVLSHRGLREVTSGIAGVIASHLWAVVVARHVGDDVSGAIVDRDGGECLRVDLRTVPAVREATRQRTGAMVVELLELHDLRVENGELALRVKLPGFP